MKKFLVVVMAVLFFIPSVGMSFQSMKKRTPIGRDKEGGYSEGQKDYKKRIHDRNENKTRPGYYEDSYHNQSADFKQGEYQFVKSGKNAHSKKKHEKKHSKF